VQSFD
jgi:hypothetical protein